MSGIRIDNGDTALNNLSERVVKSKRKPVLDWEDIGIAFMSVDPADANDAGSDCGTGYGRIHWLREEEAGEISEDNNVEIIEGFGDSCDDK